MTGPADDLGHRAGPIPAAPWSLDGEALLACLLVPRGGVPPGFAEHRPPGWSPIEVGRRLLIGVVAARYGGDLRYREVAAAQLVRRGLRIAVCVGAIWVDDERAEQGGRDLWAIPKRRAAISYRTDRARRSVVATADAPLVRATALGHLPGLLPITLGFSTAQRRIGRPVVARHRLSARATPAGGRWTFAASGELAWLRSARQVGTVLLCGLDLRFGLDTGPRR